MYVSLKFLPSATPSLLILSTSIQLEITSCIWRSKEILHFYYKILSDTFKVVQWAGKLKDARDKNNILCTTNQYLYVLSQLVECVLGGTLSTRVCRTNCEVRWSWNFYLRRFLLIRQLFGQLVFILTTKILNTWMVFWTITSFLQFVIVRLKGLNSITNDNSSCQTNAISIQHAQTWV